MSGAPFPDRLSEVQRLATVLCSQVLDAQIMNRPIPADQTVALVKAARLLQDHDIEWPPMLAQALHGLAKNTDEDRKAELPASENDGNPVIQGLNRLVGVFRRDRLS